MGQSSDHVSIVFPVPSRALERATTPQPDDLVGRLKNIGIGESIIYHQGNLSIDRIKDTGKGVLVNRVADIAFQKSRLGEVELKQVKRGYEDYIYLAVGIRYQDSRTERGRRSWGWGIRSSDDTPPFKHPHVH